MQHHRRQRRYTDLLLESGIPREHIEAAKTADRWRPMLERMRRSEQLGLDLRAALQTAHQRGKPDQMLARVDAGLAAWNADQGTKADRRDAPTFPPLAQHLVSAPATSLRHPAR